MMVGFKTNACLDNPELGIVASASATGAQRDFGAGVYRTTHRGCVTGSDLIGTITVTPNDDDNAGSVVAVLALKNQNPDTCAANPKQAGCIVARRHFTFVRHTPLRMELYLDLACEGQPCDAFTTCKGGKCVDATAECDAKGDCRGSADPARIDAGADVDTTGPQYDLRCPMRDSCPGATGAPRCDAPGLCCFAPQGCLGGKTVAADASSGGSSSSGSTSSSSGASGSSSGASGSSSGASGSSSGASGSSSGASGSSSGASGSSSGASGSSGQPGICDVGGCCDNNHACGDAYVCCFENSVNGYVFGATRCLPPGATCAGSVVCGPGDQCPAGTTCNAGPGGLRICR